MRFDFLTIFPHIFDSYLQESMIKRALKKRLISVRVHDLRRWGQGPHKKVDDRPYGGGPGMILKIEPIIKALGSIFKTISNFQFPISKQIQNSKLKIQNRVKIVLLSPAGKQFTAKLASSWAKKYDQIIFICGRYEGVDVRLAHVLLQTTNYKLQAVSAGPYVLSGGELPALTIMEAMARHIPGFLGKEESLEERRLGVGVPMYTRPEIFKYKLDRGKEKVIKVPKVLLSGDHGRVLNWREKNQKSSHNS